MKIVGFEANNGARLGILDGDNVVDLQAADANLPGDLGEVLRRSNGDLKPLVGLAKNAPASARRPLAGLKFALPVARPAARQYPEVSLDFFPRVDFDGAASAADRQAARVDPARL